MFSAEAFRYICDDRGLAKHAPDRIAKALDKYDAEQDESYFWSALSDLKQKLDVNGLEIEVYLALIARRKNIEGKYYYTAMLDSIFAQIEKRAGSGDGGTR